MEAVMVATRDRLHDAFLTFDDQAMLRVLDEALAEFPVEEVLTAVCFPFLRRLGEDWEAGRLSIAQEHFGSGVVRNRLAALGPVLPREEDRSRAAVLACTPHERHDIGLLGLDLVLRSAAWGVTFLGADTPITDALIVARGREADVLVLAGTEPHMFAAQIDHHAAELTDVGSRPRIALGGPAARPEVCARIGALRLVTDAAAAAAQLEALVLSGG